MGLSLVVRRAAVRKLELCLCNAFAARYSTLGPGGPPCSSAVAVKARRPCRTGPQTRPLLPTGEVPLAQRCPPDDHASPCLERPGCRRCLMTTDPAKVTELQRWMTDKEGENCEFKEAKNNFHFETLAKYCCALANEG